MRKLGQHFLRNTNILERIASQILSSSPEIIIEIGPGHGELTRHLLASESPRKIIVIERDIKLIPHLQESFQSDPRFEIVEGDALKILPLLISQKKIKQYSLAGNIPYYITGHLLRTIGELPTKPQDTTLLIQKEVAERMAATPPKMNRLAASVQFWGVPKILFSVPPESFSPPPQVDSAVIHIRTKLQKGISMDVFNTTLQTLFAQPRKTLLNNLCSRFPKEEAQAILLRCHLDPQQRPEQLSLQNIFDLAKKIKG